MVESTKPMDPTIRYRPGTPDDSYAVFLIFEEALYDLLPRLGIQPESRYDEPEKLARIWAQRKGLFKHLAVHHEQFWVAEVDGKPAGYSRSIRRDGILQLTEFFVKPFAQAMGVGRELLERSFAGGGGELRSIIATLDVPAQASYLKRGVYPQFPTMYFSKTPAMQPAQSQLAVIKTELNEEALEILAQIDRQVLTFTRSIDHRFLASDRDLFLYKKDRQPAGYGYAGETSGPFSLLDPADFPAVLNHAENLLAVKGVGHFGMEVPLINRHAVDHLLANGFRMDAFVAFVMTSRPFGKFDRYILSNPPFFL